MCQMCLFVELGATGFFLEHVCVLFEGLWGKVGIV